MHPLNEDKKQKAISDAALMPRVFQEIHENSPGISEDVLTNMLVHKNFTEDAAKRAASIYTSNFTFANLGKLSNVELSTVEPQQQTEISINTPHRTTQIAKTMYTHPHTLSAVNSNELSVPFGDDMFARVPFPITEEDFQLLLATLTLWKKKLVTKPSAPNQTPTEDIVG